MFTQYDSAGSRNRTGNLQNKKSSAWVRNALPKRMVAARSAQRE